MYKAKLQELCQERRWGLPRYTSMKDGADHLPHFKASVHVNGLSFHSPTISTSSKQAHNLAAKLAFLHFSSSSGSSSVAAGTMDEGQSTEGVIQSSESHSSALGVANCSSTPRNDKSKTGETNHHMETNLHASSIRNGEYLQDLQYQYKSQLQNYARSKNLDTPLYSSKREGPPHALRFKATVTIDGHTYESLEFFNTLKQSENAAAKVALMSLLQDDFQEEDSGFYKNVLHELAQKELFCTPTYETVKCGPSHMPTFFSTVEVDGEIFYGKAGKSKKQAEWKAAKVAYDAFKDQALRWGAEFISPDSPADEVLNSLATSVQIMTVDTQQNLKPQLPLLSPPTIGYEELAEEKKGTEFTMLLVQLEGDHGLSLLLTDSPTGEVFSYSASTDQVFSVDAENSVTPGFPSLSSLPVSYEEHAKESKDEVQEVDSADILSDSAEATTQDTHSSSVKLDIDEINTKGSSTACAESVPVALQEDSVSMMAPLELSASSTDMTRNTSYLLCGRVRVYPCFPDFSFPKGITVLPISDDKWVAISLEFPNEIGY